MPASASFCAARDVGAKPFDAVSFGFCRFADHGKHRRFPGSRNPIQPNDLLA